MHAGSRCVVVGVVIRGVGTGVGVFGIFDFLTFAGRVSFFSTLVDVSAGVRLFWRGLFLCFDSAAFVPRALEELRPGL